MGVLGSVRANPAVWVFRGKVQLYYLFNHSLIRQYYRRGRVIVEYPSCARLAIHITSFHFTTVLQGGQYHAHSTDEPTVIQRGEKLARGRTAKKPADPGPTLKQI